MSHPLTFDENDPILRRLRKLALAFPGAAEKISHGRPAFYTRTVFTYYGGSQRIDGEWIPYPHSLVIQPDPQEREALLADPRVYLPGYLGPWGWLGCHLFPPDAVRAPSERDAAALDWDEIAELVDASFRQTASPRLIKQLLT